MRHGKKCSKTNGVGSVERVRAFRTYCVRFVAVFIQSACLVACEAASIPSAPQTRANPKPYSFAAPKVAEITASTLRVPREPEPMLERPKGLSQALWAGATEAQLLEGLARAKALKFRAVGSTSTVFKMLLRAPYAGAFKAQTKARRRGPAAEIASYRAAKCLGLDQVPPAVSRTFSVAELKAGFVRNKRADFSTVLSRISVQGASGEGQVRGAAIFWIPDLRSLGVDKPSSIRRFRRLLSQPGPPSQDPLAADVSTMALFDYLIGNYDRYSGSNAKGNTEGTRLYFRDHDVAFPAQLPERLRQRMWEQVASVEMFSKTFVGALRKFDSNCLFSELAQDPAFATGEPIEQSAYESVFARQRQVLEHVDQLIGRYGSEAVLVFD